MTGIIDRSDLYYRQGSSDKEYHTTLEEAPGGYVVNFTYGRHGSPLRPGTKTQAPVALEKARAIFARLLTEKMGEGYLPGQAGGSVVTPAAVAPAEWMPQLLNPVEEEDVAALITSPDWGMQEKHDGVNRLVGLTEALEPFGVSRKGEPASLPEEVVVALRALGAKTGRVVLAGEGIGARVIAHDLLWLKRTDYRPVAFADRHAVLAQIATHFDGALGLSPLAVTAADKQAMYTRLKTTRAEGVVFKRLNAAYRPGRPASGGDQLKLKFWATATAIVTRINDKASVGLSLLDESGALVFVGNVTVPANHALPAVSDLVEVRYLYCYRNGSLYQPVYLGRRDDIDQHDCTTRQLKYKAGPETP